MNLKRRDFLKTLGMATAAGAMAGCSSHPVERLIPFLIPPEEIVPGVATWYATVCRECPAGCGMLVRTREGRAVKVEGNPLHPVNRGRLCARGQASLQGLYDPDRIRQPLKKVNQGQHQPVSWDEAEDILSERLRRLSPGKAAFLSSLETGSLARLLETWCVAFGAPPPLFFEPISHEEIREANRITFGEPVIPSYRLEEARALFSFGADFLETYLSPVEFARDFASMHSHAEGKGGVFVHFSPRLSLTAANADEWVEIRPGSEAAVALCLVHIIVKEGLTAHPTRADANRIVSLVEGFDPGNVGQTSGISEESLVRLARVFVQNEPGLALGPHLPGGNGLATQIAVNLLNHVAGNLGRTVQYGPNLAWGRSGSYGDVLALKEAMARGDLQVLLVHEANPVYSLPPASGLQDALRRVPFLVSFSSVLDETTSQADLVLPTHTPFESWGDYSPREGVVGLLQPVVNPILQTRAIGDVLLDLTRKMGGKPAQTHPWQSFYHYLQDSWRKHLKKAASEEDFVASWQAVVQQGGLWEPVPLKSVRLAADLFKINLRDLVRSEHAEGLQLVVYPSTRHFDGRGANRSWLHELPDPMTQVVWDSWLEIHPDAAKALGLREGELVSVTSAHGTIEVPVLLSPGINPRTVAMSLGLGHTSGGLVAEGKGLNPLLLLSGEPEQGSGAIDYLGTRVKLSPTGRHYALVSPQGSPTQAGRGLAQSVTLSDLRNPPDQHQGPEELAAIPMYKPHEHPHHRWGMAIDLDRCTGCGACELACYAENNLAVVGKDQVRKRRQMPWVWIERYFEPDGSVRFLPMLCQQCDYAPCEPVCPLFAVYHTPEGLNAMVYARCVGTRYCSANCPYKVRRFNWLQPTWREPLNWQLNPDVTPREKGVIEKCTFCVQRIASGKDRAKDENREVRDGEIQPACAQTCPTGAIVFGDLKDPQSLVSRLTRDPRGYRVFEHLNTHPGITYLKKVTGRLGRSA